MDECAAGGLCNLMHLKPLSTELLLWESYNTTVVRSLDLNLSPVNMGLIYKMVVVKEVGRMMEAKGNCNVIGRDREIKKDLYISNHFYHVSTGRCLIDKTSS